MKWSVLALAGIGLVAAAAAAFLVAGLRANKAGAHPITPEVEVLFAAKALPALSVIDSASVVIRKMPKTEVPPNAISDPVAVVGKVLRMPMIEGEAVTPAVLASRESGINLAAAVREGMRAVSVSLSQSEALEGLLYPGGVVDVLFSFRAPAGSTDQAEETISLTLLKAVQVLAIEGRTILSTEEPNATPPTSSRGQTHQMVTLMVTPKQAELLQLAQKFGSVSLSMRNPLDTDAPATNETLLSQMSEFFRRRITAASAAALPAPPPKQVNLVETVAQTQPAKGPPPAPKWAITFIRGGAIDVESYPMPGSKGVQP